MSTLRLEHVTYALPGRAEPALRDVTLRVEPGEFVVLAGALGVGQVDARCARPAGSCRTSTGATFAGRVARRRHGHARPRPGELAAVAGTLFQDPETQIVMGTVRAELAFALENRGHGAAAVARGVEEVALALGHRATCSIARPPSSPAASCSASRSRGAGRAARRSCCSTSRPRSSTRSPATS